MYVTQEKEEDKYLVIEIFYERLKERMLLNYIIGRKSSENSARVQQRVRYIVEIRMSRERE